MRVSKTTHPEQCGEGCKALDANGADLIKRFYVMWIDEEEGEIGVLRSLGEPIVQGKFSGAVLDRDESTGDLKVLSLKVDGLRFIPAADPCADRLTGGKK